MQIINNVSNPDKMKDLKTLTNRALNTWDGGPQWLFKLADDLESGKIVGVTFFTKEDVNPKPPKV